METSLSLYADIRTRPPPMTLPEAVGQVAQALSSKALRAVLEGASALERGDPRGGKLIFRQRGELRGLSGCRGVAVEALLAAAHRARAAVER